MVEDVSLPVGNGASVQVMSEYFEISSWILIVALEAFLPTRYLFFKCKHPMSSFGMLWTSSLTFSTSPYQASTRAGISLSFVSFLFLCSITSVLVSTKSFNLSFMPVTCFVEQNTYPRCFVI
ncbi:hypothetical protein HanOQP8_Chr00c449g0831231 [Helianthus annuus]|nr:hypothetical protein HanOQP8_Chr00c449g0831231 [Helianthus annuus]